MEGESYSEYNLLYHNIHWKIDPAKHYVSGKVSFEFIATKDNLASIQFDLHDSLRVDSIKRNRTYLPYTHQNHVVTASLPNSLQINQRDSFTVFYHGIPPNTGSGAFETNLRDSVYPELWTLSEPYGAMEWWPCKQSLSDKIDSIDITLIIPDAYRAATNGLLKSEMIVGNQNVSHWKHRYPIATYLVGVAVTNYMEFSEYYKFSDEDSMLLINRVFPEYFEQAKKDAAVTPDMMNLFSDLFIPYPFKKEWYGHAQFSRGGGMEHQTMSFMSDLGFELVAHELAHQWFGNYATLNSWHDIWLNEGFATFLTGLAYENLNPDLYYRFYEVRLKNIVSKPGGSVYVPDTADVNRIFSGRLSYAKGAYLLHMLRWELGDPAFFKAIQNYLNDARLQYGYTRQELLVEHLELAGDTTLKEFFTDWYYGEGYPFYYTSWKQDGDRLFITIHQEPSHSSVDFFAMHVPIQLITANDTTDLRLHHLYQDQTFSIKVQQQVDQILFDPNIWLLSKYEVTTHNNERLELAEFNVYPNPTTDILYIETPHIFWETPFELFSITGEKIRSGILISGHNYIELSKVKSGIYILKIHADNENYTQQISIEK